MDGAQRELVRVLLDYIRSLGLISNSSYSGAVDLVYSTAEFPEFFRNPGRLMEEGGGYESAQDTQ